MLVTNRFFYPIDLEKEIAALVKRYEESCLGGGIWHDGMNIGFIGDCVRVYDHCVMVAKAMAT